MTLRFFADLVTLSALFIGVLASVAAAQQPDSASDAFSICGSGQRITCVVDGDTFWFRGEKIRIADIDTPELSPPRCQRERELGLAAKNRLLDILNSGPLSFKTTAREEDRFGRKLRIVYRDRRSVGDILVAEGLARKWQGLRRSWCE
ncbi:endonuclease YncB(thermonuclease family) [Rhizobium leguminosarum]|uniref:Endonuclease YncB(Thermonuclease family) n=1 Tax=Rhizobium leguminosarum TaxID=384 RepID=A0AAE2MQU3_RHILE|nr:MULTISPECIES: thermonuclease family protein [Rhizobium]ARM90855.1 nuclease SNase-like protein [Rhizobium sp. CIAT894]MBB4293777.1 endonuclease YncB(thermonuclease family) [Rhizobium leguminosarum]MBB4310876.1 endonuclease YncB(thermonuclease family) [Rhizobium leguminosarum]MBB4420012.1 endonuclease YncB(thermonuclease family) [Rhizobium leguminosarum]MBB4532076.1 endonuclease YncB(thermonuclease family) [Rhizobium leguminosarum]